jgi:tetratricopeptide (TPR) repeat protein
MFVFHFSFVNGHTSYVQPAYYNLGVVYSEMMQYETALTCYEKAAIERPMYAEAYCNMGVIYKNRGDLESAIACYERYACHLFYFSIGPCA